MPLPAQLYIAGFMNTGYVHGPVYGYLFLELVFFIGSTLEDKRLTAEYGVSYKLYIQQTPDLIPLPWNIFNKQKLQQILSKSKNMP